MRWQKVARLAIALFVIAFAGFVFLAMRHRVAPAPGKPAVTGADPEAIMESGAGERKGFTLGKLTEVLKFDKVITYKDGRSKFVGVTLTLPDRNGRTFVVTADEGELVAPPDKPGDPSVAKVRGHVKLTADNGLEVLGNEADYDGKEGVVKVPGPVTFTRGRMKGSGVGATYDQNRQVIWLLANARINVVPDEAGGGAIDASASTAGLARAENYVKLVGNARLTADTRTAEADEITALLDEKGEKIQQLQLRERSRITGTGGGAQLMTARNIDLNYAPDGRTLQSTRQMEGSVIELPGAAGAAAKRIRGTTIETVLSPDGATVINLNAQEKVQVEIPAEGESPARTIRSATLHAAGPPDQGLQNAVFEGGIEFDERRPAVGKSPAVERHARSARLIVDTKPGFGAIERADFRGHAHFEDRDVSADAPRALYSIDRDQLDLSPFENEPGKGPLLNNTQLTVQARNIHLSPSTQKLKADTDVRSTIKPRQAAAANATPSAAPAGRGNAAAPAQPDTRLPAMLKQDQPVNVTSNRLDYDGTAEATYTGSAILWQDKSRIEAETIVINDDSGNLTAKGNVRSTMMLQDEDPKTKVRKLTETRATADNLVYVDAKRLATYTSTGNTPASVKSLQGDMSGKIIELFLRENGNELDHAVLDTNVAVKLTNMFATGNHHVYTAETDTHVMTGNPVISVQKDEKGSCKQTLSSTLTYRRAVDSISAEAISGIAGTETKPIPCPAELRH
jgi:lipopolysaccharide export system protein LptA